MSGIKSVGKDCIPNKPTVYQSGIKPLPTKKEFLIRASIIAMVTSPKEMSDKQRSGFVIGLSGFVKRSFCCLTGLTNLKQTLTNPKKPVAKHCIPNKPTVCQSGIKSQTNQRFV